MLVECIGNTITHLSCERTKDAFKRNIHQEEVWLEIGRLYTVYGITFRDGENLPWFLVCEDEDECPKPHLGEFFKIVNGEIPSGWDFTTSVTNLGEIGILPQKWATDSCFMEKLVNEESEAWDYFSQLKASLNK